MKIQIIEIRTRYCTVFHNVHRKYVQYHGGMAGLHLKMQIMLEAVHTVTTLYDNELFPKPHCSLIPITVVLNHGHNCD